MARSFLFLFLSITSVLFSQNEYRNWYFGENAGLNFPIGGGAPTVLLDGQANTLEGVSTISDSDGNLSFYTDGITVWNKNHAVMTNGNGLLGNPSSTQSAVIVPKPNSSTIYYIFTAAAGITGSINYTEVDMADGVGTVTANKNILVQSPASEHLSAFRTCNGNIWVATISENSFYAFLVTNTGVDLTAKVSSLGQTMGFAGQLKFSPLGNKIGICSTPVGGFFIYDFDQTTGQIANRINLSNTTLEYGCEFSSDGSKFYGSGFGTKTIYQWNLNAGTNVAIIASRQTIQLYGGTAVGPGSLQLGPDKKIYIARPLGSFLSIINNPDSLGSLCNFIEDAISLGGRISQYGLPNCISTALSPVSSFTTSASSGRVPLALSFSNTSTNATSYSWDFGNNDTSSSISPSYIYQRPGTFIIRLIAKSGCSDTSYATVVVDGNEEPLIVPNVFSPNKDGINELFFIDNPNHYTNLICVIYNRWGQEIASISENGNWDGNKLNGLPAEEGVYYYTLNATNSLGNEVVQNGTISLLRK